MNTKKCHDRFERRQLDVIQRIGRIGYWSYDCERKSISLPETSLSFLASIVGSPLNASRPLMEALPDVERKRFQIALDEAVSKRLTLNIELQVENGDGKHAYIVVRGTPVDVEHAPLQFAGIFQDITKEKHREADHEKLITQLQALLDALPQGVSVIDNNLRLILWNRRFHEVLDFPQSMVFRQARFEDFIRLNAVRGEYGPGDPEEQVQAIVARAREFVSHRFERQVTGGRTVLVEGFPFKSSGEVSGFVTTYTDITDQKRTEEQLTRQRDVMKTIIDNFPGAISLCDADLRMTAYNDQLLELLDFPSSLFAKGWVHFEDLARFNANRGEYGPGDPEEQAQAIVARAHNFQAHDMERERPNGRWLEIRGTPISSGGFVTSYIDITGRKRIEAELELKNQQLEELSVTDRLTGLFNRRKLDEVLSQECARAQRTRLPLTVIIADIDKFKSVNDNHGHQVGDQLLVEIAGILRQRVRTVDTVGRWGGEEFMIFCPATNLARACTLAEDIRCAIENYNFSVIGHKTSCFGVAEYRPSEAPEAVIKRADKALYHAKNEGRNRVKMAIAEAAESG